LYIIIHSKITFLSNNARLHLRVCLIGCCHLQNGCQLHYHAADSVLSSGYSFISQQIWINILIKLAILAICINIEKWSAGKRRMYIHLSRWHTFDFGSMSSVIVTGWHKWRSRRRWHQFWCQLSELVWSRCASAFAPPACLRSLCGASLARKAASRLIFTHYSQVSFHSRLHMSMPRNWTSRIFASGTLAQVSLLRYCVSFIREP